MYFLLSKIIQNYIGILQLAQGAEQFLYSVRKEGREEWREGGGREREAEQRPSVFF